MDNNTYGLVGAQRACLRRQTTYNLPTYLLTKVRNTGGIVTPYSNEAKL